MYKIFLNLFLIVIIYFLASFIPLDTSEFESAKNTLNNFTVSKPKPVEDMESINRGYRTNISETHLHNPTNMQFIMIGEFDKGSFSLDNDHDIILEVYRNDNLIKKYVNTEFIVGLDDTKFNKNEIKYSINISQENLDLKNGQYRFKIFSTLEIFDNVPPYEVFVNYLNSSDYISAKNTVRDGEMYITLYFPNDNHEYLVPISRKIPKTGEIYRKIINNLLLGANPSLGLNSGSPIPHVPRIWVSSGMATIYLPNNIGIYDQSSTVSQSALNSFVNTLTSLNGIDRVKFLKGGREVERFFHNTYIKEPFQRNSFPRVYLGLQTNTERLLLAPIEISENNIEMEQLVKNIFNSLQTGIVNNYHHESLLALIPRSVELLNYEHSNNLLTLNLSKDFINIYNKEDGIKKMMLDSILYSFTSIPEVDKISIKVNGNPVDSFGGVDLSKAIAAPKFINVEI